MIKISCLGEKIKNNRETLPKHVTWQNHSAIAKFLRTKKFKSAEAFNILKLLKFRSAEAIWVEIATEMKKCFRLKDKLNFNALWNF